MIIDPSFNEVLVGIGVFLLIVLLLSEILDRGEVFSLEACGYSTIVSFGYNTDDGPHTWKLTYPESTGSNQSPINIVTRLAVAIQASESLKWCGYSLQPRSMTLTNDGTSVVLTGSWSSDSVPSLRGGPLNGLFNFHSIIFHWGPSNDDGSEHTLDYMKYAMEIQMVYLKNGYSTLNDPCLLKSRDGVVIISFLLQITNVDNPYLDHVITNLWRISNPGSVVQIPPFPLEWIYPPFEDNFYSYSGSLTRPPCNEIVTWIIQPEPIAISSSQIAKFRKLQSFRGPILLNTRPVQKLNNREVYFHE